MKYKNPKTLYKKLYELLGEGNEVDTFTENVIIVCSRNYETFPTMLALTTFLYEQDYVWEGLCRFHTGMWVFSRKR